MKIEKVIIVNRGELASEFAGKVVILATDIMRVDAEYHDGFEAASDIWEEGLRVALHNMKRRHCAAFIARAVVLLEMIELFDIFIDQKAFNVLRVIAAQEF